MTTFTSNLVRPTSLTRGMTRNGRMMSLVVRYLKWRHTLKKKKKCTQWPTLCTRIIIYRPHELVLSIRWDEADAALRVKLAESHTLVEGAVVDGDGLLSAAEKHTMYGTFVSTYLFLKFFSNFCSQYFSNTNAYLIMPISQPSDRGRQGGSVSVLLPHTA